MKIELLIYTTLVIGIIFTICVEASEQSNKNHRNQSDRNNNYNRNHSHGVNTRTSTEKNHENNNILSRRNVTKKHSSLNNNQENMKSRTTNTQTHHNNLNSSQHVARGHNSMQNHHNSNSKNKVHHNGSGHNITPEVMNSSENNQNQLNIQEINEEKKEQLRADLEQLNESVTNLLNKYHELKAKKSTTTISPTTTPQQDNLLYQAQLADLKKCQTVVPTAVVPTVDSSPLGEQVLQLENPSVECLQTIESVTTVLPPCLNNDDINIDTLPVYNSPLVPIAPVKCQPISTASIALETDTLVTLTENPSTDKTAL